MVDVGGLEIMTADKVTLRLNAVVTYKIVDARKAVSQTDDVRQALYRETQLVLRGGVGAREHDVSWRTKMPWRRTSRRTSVVGLVAPEGAPGLEITSVGIRNVILPGDMKDLMNKGTEAKKAAEANLISRCEEHAVAGQYGQATGGEPRPHATAGTGSPGEDRRERQAEYRHGREGPGRQGGQPVVMSRLRFEQSSREPFHFLVHIQ